MAVVTQSYSQSSTQINGQSLEYINQQVIAQMPAAPDSLVSMTLQNVVRDFYYKSGAWREVIGPYYIAQNNPLIALNPVDQYSQVHLVHDLYTYPDPYGNPVPFHLQPTLRRVLGPDTGPPRTYWMIDNQSFYLYPNPDKNYGSILYAYASMMPVINTGMLPDIAITHHFDALFYGTLWRMGTMAGKPWTVKDSTLLNEWRRTYRREILINRDIAERSFARLDAPNTFPNFAGRYSQGPASAAGPSFRG